MAADPTPRLRRLKSTGAMIVWHPCTYVMPDGSYCGKEAPYGYEVKRQSRGRWTKPKGKEPPTWRGQEPQVEWGYWRCKEHRT